MSKSRIRDAAISVYLITMIAATACSNQSTTATKMAESIVAESLLQSLPLYNCCSNSEN